MLLLGMLRGELLMQVVEMEHIDGYRFWSNPLEDHEVTEYIQHFTMLGYHVSDIDTAADYSEYSAPGAFVTNLLRRILDSTGIMV
jgi:hypothetical protein